MNPMLGWLLWCEAVQAGLNFQLSCWTTAHSDALSRVTAVDGNVLSVRFGRSSGQRAL